MFNLDKRARESLAADLPNLMPVISTAQYRRSDGLDALQLVVKNLFSFDLIHREKMWWFDNSERSPRGRFAPKRRYHRNPGRVRLEVAQILFINGLSVLRDDVRVPDDFHYMPDMPGDAHQLLEADLTARSAYLYVLTQAQDKIRPRPIDEEIFFAKQFIGNFNTWLENRGISPSAWLRSEPGSRLN